jgi:hypothetical protein
MRVLIVKQGCSMLHVRVVGHFGVLESVSKVPQLIARNLYETPDNEIAHPTMRSQNTLLSDDNLIIEISHCRMRDLVLVI